MRGKIYDLIYLGTFILGFQMYGVNQLWFRIKDIDGIEYGIFK